MADPPASQAPQRTKRADARRNRERLLTAAMEVLGNKGVHAQMADIAEAAGLGVGTLYRNFPTKADLVHALVLERLDRAKLAAEEAAQEEDAWEALVALLHRFAEHWMESRLLSQFLGGHIGAGSAAVEEQRDRTFALIADLVERAQRDGKLRKDVGIPDIQVIHLTIAHLASRDTPLTQDTIKRHVGIVIDGLRAPGTTKLPPHDAPLSPGSGRQPEALRRGQRSWRAQPSP